MLTQFVLSKTYCWVAWNMLLFPARSPQFVFTPFPASRTEVCSQRILWWIWVGFQLLYLVLTNWKKLKESHKNHMTKQLKINKRNEAVSRPFVSTHRYEVNQSTQPIEMGALGREEPHCEIMYLSWLFSKSPRLRSSGNPQAIHQQLEDFIQRAQLPLFLNRDWKHRLLCKRILSLLFPS